jgi:hypothetical protein
MAVAWALIADSPLTQNTNLRAPLTRHVFAVCGNKDGLKERKVEYYKAFYDYAHECRELAVVRVFRALSPGPSATEQAEVIARHRTAENVLAVEAEAAETSEPDGLGLVLFRHSGPYTALVHWDDERGDLKWCVTSDPLLTLVFRDWLGTFLTEARVEAASKADKTGINLNAAVALARRFGIHLPPTTTL